MQRLPRATAIRLAAVISFLLGLSGFMNALPSITKGATMVNQVIGGPPFWVIFGSFVFALVQIVASYGTWHNQRASIVITILVAAGNALLSVPGILFAPTTNLQIGSTIGTLVCLLIIALCLWRDAKPLPPN